MIDRNEYARRRKQLMRIIGRDAIAIVPAAPERVRNNDSHYPYRQDSDFHYLTGFPEPEAVLALIPGREHGEVILFCRERNAEREAWDGRHAARPFVLVAQPSAFDSTRAPYGRHVLWTYCHTPSGSTLEMLPRIEQQIERFAPRFRDRVIARSVIRPLDFEQRNPNYVGGDIGAGAVTLR